jgi:cation transport ATPase
MSAIIPVKTLQILNLLKANNMNTQQTINRTADAAQTVKTKIKKVIEKFQESFVFKVAVVAAVTVGGLLALGGLYRVLAWTMQGWNQFSATLK